MGTGAGFMLNLFKAMHPERLPADFRMLEMGNSQSYGARDQFRALFGYLGISEPRATELAARYDDDVCPPSIGAGVYNLDLYPMLGVNYECADYVQPTTIQADFNADRLPGRLRGAFDLVTNFGTSEHVADQMNFFRYMHDATKVGGVMVHMVPSIGYIGHCLYKYDQKFFPLLAAANGYEVLSLGFGEHENGTTLDADCSNWVRFDELRGKVFDSRLVEAILRKTRPTAFRPPIDAPPAHVDLPDGCGDMRSFPPRLTFPRFQAPAPPPRPARFPTTRRAIKLLALAAQGDADARARVRKRLRL